MTSLLKYYGIEFGTVVKISDGDGLAKYGALIFMQILYLLVHENHQSRCSHRASYSTGILHFLVPYSIAMHMYIGGFAFISIIDFVIDN